MDWHSTATFPGESAGYSAARDQLLAAERDLRKRVESTQPALRIDFGQVIADMLGDLMTTVQPIEIKVFGDNPARLRELARRVAATVSTVKGTADVFDGTVMAGPSIRVEPDYGKLALMGLTPAGLHYQVQNAIEGNVLGTIPEKEQLTNIRTVYPGNRALGVNELKNLPIFLANGRLIPISSVANIFTDSGDAEVQRENLQAMSAITARLDNRDLGSVMGEIKGAIAKNIVLPQGYTLEYGGNYMEQQQSFRDLIEILAAAVLLVVCVTLFLFRDVAASLIILFISLFGIAGSGILLYLTGTALNVGSYTGIIMVVGVIGENAIFTFWQFKDGLRTMPVGDAVVFAIGARLRPKLMTATAAIAALLPLALGLGTGAKLHKPLAIAVTGGLLAALPMLLVVLPAVLKTAYGRRKAK